MSMANSSLRIARTLALMLVITSVSVQTNHLWAQEKNFLWKASGDKNTVYILGSIHLLKRESAALKPIVQEVFSKSKRLV